MKFKCWVNYPLKVFPVAEYTPTLEPCSRCQVLLEEIKATILNCDTFQGPGIQLRTNFSSTMTALYCRLHKSATAFKGNACQKFTLGSATEGYAKIQILFNTLVSDNILKNCPTSTKASFPHFQTQTVIFCCYTGAIKSLHTPVKTPGFYVGKKNETNKSSQTFNQFNASN